MGRCQNDVLMKAQALGLKEKKLNVVVGKVVVGKVVVGKVVVGKVVVGKVVVGKVVVGEVGLVVPSGQALPGVVCVSLELAGDSSSWLTATKEQLSSDARTYYNTHIQPFLTERTSEDSKVLAIRNTPQANRSGYRNFNKSTDNRNVRNNRGNINRNNNGPRPRAASSSNNLWSD
jgi:hypothetical protein